MGTHSQSLLARPRRLRRERPFAVKEPSDPAKVAHLQAIHAFNKFSANRGSEVARTLFRTTLMSCCASSITVGAYFFDAARPRGFSFRPALMRLSTSLARASTTTDPLRLSAGHEIRITTASLSSAMGLPETSDT